MDLQGRAEPLLLQERLWKPSAQRRPKSTQAVQRRENRFTTRNAKLPASSSILVSSFFAFEGYLVNAKVYLVRRAVAEAAS